MCYRDKARWIKQGRSALLFYYTTSTCNVKRCRLMQRGQSASIANVLIECMKDRTGKVSLLNDTLVHNTKMNERVTLWTVWGFHYLCVAIKCNLLSLLVAKVRNPLLVFQFQVFKQSIVGTQIWFSKQPESIPVIHLNSLFQYSLFLSPTCFSHGTLHQTVTDAAFLFSPAHSGKRASGAVS